MTIISIRKQLHQLIDTLPEQYLLELWRFIQRLQLRWKNDAQNQPDDSDLVKFVTKVQNTSPTPDSITLPTKSWATYANEVSNPVDKTFEASNWNQQWDALEAEMKAKGGNWKL